MSSQLTLGLSMDVLPKPLEGFQEVREHVPGWEAYLDVQGLISILIASKEISGAVKESLQTALIELVRQGRDVDKAVATLAHVGRHGDGRVIRAVVLGLAFGGKRRVIHRALTRLCDKKESTAVEAVSCYFGHHDGAVRREAITVIKQFARRGDTQVVPKLVGALADSELRVRMAATDALREVARRGDPQTAALVVQHLVHQCSGVREAALITLTHLAAPDRGDVIVAICQCMNDADIEGRKALLGALQQLAPTGDPQAVEEIVRRLTDSSIEVRKTALGVFGVVAEDAERFPDVHALLSASLEDPRASVRKAAISAVEKIASNNTALQSLIFSRLDDAATSVRSTAILAAGRICDPQDQAIVRKLASFMEVADPSSQVAAQQALGRLLQRGSKAPLPVLQELLWHPSPQVRESANAALDRLPQQMQWLRENWSPGKPPSRMRAALLWTRSGFAERRHAAKG